jgi:DNA-binding response OmpR family regulator
MPLLSASRHSPPSVQETEPAGDPRRRVLIVEDDADTRALLEIAMLDAGFEVHVQADGSRAVKAVEALKPAVVILDWMLPGRSGLEACTAIRALPELAGTRIVMLSSRRRDDDVERGYRAGADRYFVKPVVTRVLVRHVREFAAAAGPAGEA